MEGSAEIIDNLRVRMGDVLAREVKAGDRLCAVTEMFSLSAFSRLKDKLLSVKDARFIFSAPTFTPAATLAERMDKARRQFMVSEQNHRESSVVADEYELKLKQFLETHDLKRTPVGIHAVVRAEPEKGLVPGVVFFLKNRDPKLRDKANYFHPFYSVYVADDGTRLAGATVQRVGKGAFGVRLRRNCSTGRTRQFSVILSASLPR